MVVGLVEHKHCAYLLDCVERVQTMMTETCCELAGLDPGASVYVRSVC